MASRHVYQMGIIGNCAYMAHINRRARVMWLCWPRFDSSFLFGGLLASQQQGGDFSITPTTPGSRSHQYYLENTNILCTEFQCRDGRFRVIDFAPRFSQYERFYKPLMLMRKIERLAGSPKIQVCCRPMGEYGRQSPHASMGSNHIRYLDLEAPVRLTTDVPLTYVMEETPFVLTDNKYLTLTWGPPLEAPLASTVESFLHKTIQYWQLWVEHCTVPAFQQELVIRSALVLKIHQYEDTGAIIAAGTTSLPEAPNSGRTWDYRYCWVRDSYYTLSAFNHIGQFEEMMMFSDYIQNLVYEAKDRMQPVYGIGRETILEEREQNLRGYLGNRPVRVGNQAYQHIQNDVYGQILLSLLPLYVDRRFVGSKRLTSLEAIHKVLDWIESTIHEPDAGLWELRHEQRQHCYTFLFHWAGCAATAQIARELNHPALLRRALELQKQAGQQIESCYDPKMEVYTHAAGSPFMDASLLQLITMRYLDPSSDRAKRLLTRIEQELMERPGYLYRYRHPDDFGTPEVCFLVCGFWYAEALATMGQIEKAKEAFEQLVQCSNPLGLLSEDASPKDDSQWGNFPQTYSHVGVINVAFRIANKLDLPPFLTGPLPHARHNHISTPSSRRSRR